MASQHPLSPPLQNTAAPRHKEPDPSDIANLRKWQEARLTRKLQGEYESAVLHLSQLVGDNLSTPLSIAAVRVEGAHHTRQSFLAWLINPHLKHSSSDTSTLKSVLRTTQSIRRALSETDAFHSVEAKIERSRDSLENDVDLVFKTQEKGRYFMKTATEMGNGEGNASVTVKARNAFGGAETLEANISLGTQTRRAYHASLSLPLLPNLKTSGILSAFGTDRDNRSYASSTEGLRGLKASIRTQLAGASYHEITYEAVSRHLSGLTPLASISMREAAGHSLKSSLSHTLLLDTRDDKLTGTRGYYVKVFHEIAGLGGDARFHKIEAEGQFSRPLLSGTWISFAARAGHLQKISNTAIVFSDRFQLGGPLSVRSFRANSMGPRDGADSLGGDVHWSAGVSLISNIPKKAHWPVKTHVFLNAGKLDSPGQSKSLRDCVSKPSVAAGVGLIYRFDPVRVEVNFGIPLVASKSDGSRRGFQVGIGLDFL